jgi:hypothetical protein
VQQPEKKIALMSREKIREVFLFFSAEVLVSEEGEEKPEAEAVEGEEVLDFRTGIAGDFK